MLITNQANLPIAGKGAGRHFFSSSRGIGIGADDYFALMALLGLPAQAGDVFSKANGALNTLPVTGSTNWSSSHLPDAGKTFSPS